MIIYSQSGTKPCEQALKKVLLSKKFAITFIKDNKYVIKREPTEDYLNVVFNEKLPYCISDGASSATKKRVAFWNPAVVCKSSNGDWVAFSNYKMEPIGNYEQMENDDVYYADFKYKTEYKKAQQLLPLKYTTSNPYAEQLLRCFTKQFELPYGDYDVDKKRWLKSVQRDIARPFFYERCLYIGKRGGWCIDEGLVDIDWSSMQEGTISNKMIGKVDSYVRAYIESMKDEIIKLGASFDYSDKEYYECEMQSVFIILCACKMLQVHKKKMSADNVMSIIEKVKTTADYAIKNHCLVEEYFIWHMDELLNTGLLA